MDQLFANLPTVTAPPRSVQPPRPRPSRAKPKRDVSPTFGLIVTDPQAHSIQAMRKTRRCLSCDRQFNSHGPGNRICTGCKEREIWTSGAVDFSISTASF